MTLKDVIPSTPGIYAIVNTNSGHFYVGSAANLFRRRKDHFKGLKAGTHRNAHLQHAYNLYGPDSFRFDVLENVEHVEDLIIREQHYIGTLLPEYNIARTAGSSRGIKRTPEHIAKLSAANLAHPAAFAARGGPVRRGARP